MILYCKKGRRYVEVRDVEASTSLADGSWLVIVKDGKVERHSLSEPDYAAFLLATKTAREAMLERMTKVSLMTPHDQIWRDLLGSELVMLSRDSAEAIVAAGIKAVVDEWRKNKGS